MGLNKKNKTLLWVILAVGGIIMLKRDQPTDRKARVIAIAKRELETWGGRKETDPAMYPRLMAYWRAAGLSSEEAKSAIDRRAYWSAAFVNYVLKEAGAPYLPSPSHVGYLAAAKRAGRLYPANSKSPQPGNIVCFERDNSGVNWANVDDGTFKAAHCDVVTAKSGNAITVVGGNVSDSVTQRRFVLQNGLLTSAFAVMEV